MSDIKHPYFREPDAKEAAHFGLDDSFPQDHSHARKFLFSHTGFSQSSPMGVRGWYLLNTSMNLRYDIGLDDHTLQILSVLDNSLGEVNRWANAPHMNSIVADNTAAHTKQVMNWVDEAFHHVYPNPCTTPPEVQTMRRDALKGAWLHDMGEIVLELTTASDVFALSPEERVISETAKGAMESELVEFSIFLAAKSIELGKPDLFGNTIKTMRRHITDMAKQGKTGTLERIATIRADMAHYAEEYSLGHGEEIHEVAADLLDVYDRIENPNRGDFLHPVVKTIESLEGQRYMQRNSRFSESTSIHNSTSFEVLESCRRGERTLPMLFDRAKTPDQKKIALATADFAYESLARNFHSGAGSLAAHAPRIIDRLTKSASQLAAKDLPAESIVLVRDHERNKLIDAYHEQMDQLGDDAKTKWMDQQYMTRFGAYRMYESARRALYDEVDAFRPKTATLLKLEETPEIPAQIKKQMELMGEGRKLKEGNPSHQAMLEAGTRSESARYPNR